MERLKELRNDLGIKQKDVAAAINVDRTTYNRYENGSSEPNLETLSKIADFFGTTVDYLLGRTDDISGEKNKPHAENGAELTDAKAEAWQLIQDMDDDTIRKLVTIAKTALLP